MPESQSKTHFFRKKDVEKKPVVEATGKSAGTGLDVGFSLDGKLTLVILNADGKEVEIPMSRVQGVGEYIVLRPEENQELRPDEQAPVTPHSSPIPDAPICSKCGASIKPEAKFCTVCGKSTK